MIWLIKNNWLHWAGFGTLPKKCIDSLISTQLVNKKDNEGQGIEGLQAEQYYILKRHAELLINKLPTKCYFTKNYFVVLLS